MKIKEINESISVLLSPEYDEELKKLMADPIIKKMAKAISADARGKRDFLNGNWEAMHAASKEYHSQGGKHARSIGGPLNAIVALMKSEGKEIAMDLKNINESVLGIISSVEDKEITEGDSELNKALRWAFAELRTFFIDAAFEGLENALNSKEYKAERKRKVADLVKAGEARDDAEDMIDNMVMDIGQALHKQMLKYRGQP